MEHEKRLGVSNTQADRNRFQKMQSLSKEASKQAKQYVHARLVVHYRSSVIFDMCIRRPFIAKHLVLLPFHRLLNILSSSAFLVGRPAPWLLSSSLPLNHDFLFSAASV